MDGKIIFEKDSRTVKSPKHLQKNVFLLYLPRKFTIELATSKKIDTEVTAFLLKNSRGYIESKFKTNEINEPFYGKHRLWMEILNKSFEDNIEVGKGQPIGFFVVEPESLKFHHAPCKTKAKKQKEKLYTRQKRKRQTGGFLNCYDFAYSRRDTVNQSVKVSPGIIKGATDEINNIAQQGIDQIISREGKEIERVLPEMLRGATEDVYQTSFRLLGNF